jgi:hypothetical protein
MVRCEDAESVEQAARVKWVFGGKCECCIGGMRGICVGNGNTRVDLFAFDSMRVHGVAAYVWICAEDGRNGVELDDG